MDGIFVIGGFAISAVGMLMFWIEAFKENILWGLGCLFIAPLQLIFLLLYWDVAGKPFLIETAGLALMCVGFFLSSGA